MDMMICKHQLNQWELKNSSQKGSPIIPDPCGSLHHAGTESQYEYEPKLWCPQRILWRKHAKSENTLWTKKDAGLILSMIKTCGFHGSLRCTTLGTPTSIRTTWNPWRRLGARSVTQSLVLDVDVTFFGQLHQSSLVWSSLKSHVTRKLVETSFFGRVFCFHVDFASQLQVTSANNMEALVFRSFWASHSGFKPFVHPGIISMDTPCWPRQLERTPRPFPVLKINPEAGWRFCRQRNMGTFEQSPW